MRSDCEGCQQAGPLDKSQSPESELLHNEAQTYFH